MNGIDKLTERIATDTDQERQSILDRSREQAAQIRSSYEALAESDYAEAVEKGRLDADERVERMGNVAQLEARKLRLSAKQEMLEKAFSLAMKKLLSLPENEYVDLLSNLAAKASVTGKEALVLSVADRQRFGKKVVTSANEKLEKAGKTAELTLSEEAREFEGGLYVQDGLVETNCTFSTIVRMLREQMSGEVAKILFE